MFSIDVRVLDAIVARRIDALDHVARVMGALDAGGVTVVTAVFIVGFVLLVTRQFRATAVVAVSVVVARALSVGLKDVFEQARPPRRLALVHASGWAMPSDHAAFTAAAAVALVLAFDWGSPARRAIGAAVLGTVTAVIGFLMVYAGVHWLTDVLAGWALGAVVAGAVEVVSRALLPETPTVATSAAPSSLVEQ